ncbi:TPA: hypothetical protein ACPWIL_006125 [Pseudomonas aeruginosa]|nr:hypothetical protein [Pseudomonas aeruginosa]MDI3811438.1 hypothetical protein [Pseudomonas aeruginosa]
MTAKKKPAAPAAPAAPVITAKKPRSSKGEPPQSAADTPVAGNNTQAPADGKLVDFNFKVGAEFRKSFRLFCATHDLKQVEAIKEAVADYMSKKGWSN